MKKNQLIVAGLLLALSINAFAGVDSLIDTNDIYIAAGVGKVPGYDNVPGLSSPTVLTVSVGAGLKSLTEYTKSKNVPGSFAAEVLVRHFTDSTVSNSTDSVTISQNTIGLHVVYSYPIAKVSGLNLIVKAGANYNMSSYKETGTTTLSMSGTKLDGIVGVGASYSFLRDKASVRIMVEETGINNFGASATNSQILPSIGATFKF